MKIAVVGDSCFARNTIGYLLPNHEVIGISRSPRKPPCFSLGLKYPYHVLAVGPDNDLILRVLDDFKPEAIINFAAQGEGAASFDFSTNWRFYQTNTVGLVQLVGGLCTRTYLGRYLHVSTSELYGSVQTPAGE